MSVRKDDDAPAALPEAATPIVASCSLPIIHYPRHLITVRGNSMKRWQLGFWGCLGLTLAGCEEPEQIVPTVPPGAIIPREAPDKDNPAEAQGEAAAVAPKPTGDASR